MTTFCTPSLRQHCLPFFLTLALLLATQALHAQTTWTGNADTDWHNPANWSAGVPDASDDVTIPDVANDPVISATAAAKSIVIFGGGALTVSASDSLILNEAATRRIFNFGTVTNNGIIIIGASAAGVGDYGIDNRATFHNNAGAEIHIDRSNELGLLNNSIFNNAAKITIGAVESVGGYGIQNWGTFDNSAGGEIKLDRSIYNGLVNLGTFNNTAEIIIGATASPGAYGIVSEGVFNNNAGGAISIDRASYAGMENGAFATFTNAAEITIGAMAEVGQFGLYNRNMFNNNTGGEIHIDRSTFNALLSEGTFTNSAEITIGALASVGPRGLFSAAAFNNNAGGQISIDRTSSTALWNFYSGTFTNAAEITIGALASVGDYGIDNYAVFNNNAGGEININRSSFNGLNNQSGTFTNAANITIGALSVSAGQQGIYNKAEFNNNAGGEIKIDRTTFIALYNETGTFTNTAKITIGAVAGVGTYGIRNRPAFNNNTGGEISIDRTGYIALYSEMGTMTNAAKITIGTLGSVGSYGILNEVTFNNTPCTALIRIISNNIISNTGTFANAGSIIENANGNSNISTNTGLVQNLNSGMFTIGSGNAAVTTTGAIWTGCTNTDWATASNWHNGLVPVATDDVTIPNTTNDPVILGGTAAVAKSVTVETNASLTVNAAGSLTINGSTTQGILNRGLVENSGTIVIGNVTSVGQVGINNRNIFNNNAGGEIYLDRSVYCGLYNESGSSFTNAALITIGAVASTGLFGIFTNSNFNNNIGGVIKIDRSTSAGLNHGYGTFANAAKITIGATASVGSTGLSNSYMFNNNAGGEICIDRATGTGLVNAYFGTFTNAAQITIGATASTGTYGIENYAVFNNYAGGEIKIDRTGGVALRNFTFDSHFSNAGEIAIGTGAGVTGNGIFNQSPAILHNTSCATITMVASLENTGNFTNSGLFTVNTAQTHTNNALTNNGIIEYPQGNPIPNVTNNDLIVKPVAGECSIANALQIGGANSFTAGSTWYEDEDLTTAAGTYNQGSNVFTFTNQPIEGTHTLYCSISDNVNGCSRTVSIQVTYDDITKPTITCPANLTVSADGSCAGTVGDRTASATNLTDNCGTPTVSQSPPANTGLNGHNDSETVTLTADDSNGNTETCMFTVTLKDVTVPAAQCQAAAAEIQVNDEATIAVADVDNNSTDNCGVATRTLSKTVFTCADIGANTITLTVTDINGLASTCTATVTITDPNAYCCALPDAICQAATVVLVGNSVTVVVANVDNNSTAGCGLQSMTVSPNTFNCSHVETPQTVTLTVTDINGNSDACTATVTVVDNQAPAITCPNPVTVTCAGQVPAVNLVAVTATDNCGAPGKTHVGDATTNQTCANHKTVTRTYRATDASGNSSTCTQVITVFDNVKPNFIFVPANVTVQCNSVPAVGSPTANDGCGGPVTIVYNGQTVTNVVCTDKYTLIRQWTATDACGNTKTATQSITVTDTQKPNFTTTPANVTVQCDAIPSVATPTATDNCDTAVAVTYNGQTQTNGACANAYTLTRRWTAADNCGNTKTVTQRINVVDTGKPVFTSFPANTSIACHENPPAVGSPTASDGCGGNVTITYLGQGSTSGNCPGNYQLKRTWRATDACGNSTVATQTIQILDNDEPVFTSAPADLTIQCGQALPPLVLPTASDACGYAFVTYLGQVASGSGCAADYTVTRTWEAEDLCGNTASVSQVITVQGNNNAEEEGAENREKGTTELIAHRSSLLITPNPTTDRVWLDLSDFADEAVTVSIFSDLGRLIWERSLPAVEEQKLPVSMREAGAKAGVYTVSVRSASGAVAKRVVLVE